MSEAYETRKPEDELADRFGGEPLDPAKPPWYQGQNEILRIIEILDMIVSSDRRSDIRQKIDDLKDSLE